MKQIRLVLVGAQIIVRRFGVCNQTIVALIGVPKCPQFESVHGEKHRRMTVQFALWILNGRRQEFPSSCCPRRFFVVWLDRKHFLEITEMKTFCLQTDLNDPLQIRETMWDHFFQK